MNEKKDSQQIVVKIGSSTLTRPNGDLDYNYIDDLSDQICRCRQMGHRVTLVTSGAIRSGMKALGLSQPRTLPEKQAAAAVGQSLLMQTYNSFFEKRGQRVAQVLLTREDIGNRERYLNARNTFSKLFELAVVPIVNENDTVGVEEIRFGDNDQLAALVAMLVGADCLVILSDVEGYYPAGEGKGAFLKTVRKITTEMIQGAGQSRSGVGTGGMITKLEAARMATEAGITTVIAHGRFPGVLVDLLHGKPVGTKFLARQKLNSRKRWIAFGPTPRGSIEVNEGAKRKLMTGSASLLPVGIVEVKGDFDPGEPIIILDTNGIEIARGLTNFSAHQVRRMKGLQSDQVETLFPDRDFEEVVHRDNLVVRGGV